MELIITSLLLLVLLGLGAGERFLHVRRLKRIPIRIHVNGSRGKSTVTRLIAGALRQAGIRTVARTTGTAPRLILEDGTERQIRRNGKARIMEIRDTVRFAADADAGAVVIECMALTPGLQEVAERTLVRSSIGVITNVRDDHLDVMGPTLDDVAASLSRTIPRNSVLVTAESRYLPLFLECARKRGSRVVSVTSEQLSSSARDASALDAFPENLALALSVVAELGIPAAVALRGMGAARPDPGALRMFRLEAGGKTLYAVNAFAANDCTSTRMIVEKLRERGMVLGSLFVLYNHRTDRVDRGLRFARYLAEENLRAPLGGIMQVGPRCPGFTRTLAQQGYPEEKVIANNTARSVEKIMETIASRAGTTATVLGIGNIGGMGMKLASFWERTGIGCG